jgi:hypothetical protein
MTFAHVGGVPVEELLPTVSVCAGMGVLVARNWIAQHLRRRP